MSAVTRAAPSGQYPSAPTASAVDGLLREGLLQRPGLASLRPVLVSSSLVAAVDQRLCAATRLLLSAAPQKSAPGAREAVARAQELLQNVDALPFREVAAAVQRHLLRAQQLLQESDLTGSLALTTVLHLRLHLAAEAAGHLPPALLDEAVDWAQQALVRWQSWSQGRFGPVRCIRWDPEARYCQSLGYRFEGQDFPLRYLIDRVQHQESAWLRLQAGPLRSLVRAHVTWSRCAAR